ncbi:MmcQ/YjbR family DNA-binding protein [Agaribacterium sp. ZY112]|uniref:MmcQ/YjbR family DNA-binding protein n=1 Tax=Agaribacterium sp. ZY112 TaxID=3233574 RepID=UPI003525BABB
MTYDEYNQYCQNLTASTHVVQWGGSHVWKVGGKVFAVGGWNKDGLGCEAYSFKTSELNFNILKDEPGYRPAPYLASRGFTWIQACDMSIVKPKELKEHLLVSHHIVSLGLSKKKQRELGLIED